MRKYSEGMANSSPVHEQNARLTGEKIAVITKRLEDMMVTDATSGKRYYPNDRITEAVLGNLERSFLELHIPVREDACDLKYLDALAEALRENAVNQKYASVQGPDGSYLTSWLNNVVMDVAKRYKRNTAINLGKETARALAEHNPTALVSIDLAAINDDGPAERFVQEAYGKTPQKQIDLTTYQALARGEAIAASNSPVIEGKDLHDFLLFEQYHFSRNSGLSAERPIISSVTPFHIPLHQDADLPHSAPIKKGRIHRHGHNIKISLHQYIEHHFAAEVNSRLAHFPPDIAYDKAAIFHYLDGKAERDTAEEISRSLDHSRHGLPGATLRYLDSLAAAFDKNPVDFFADKNPGSWKEPFKKHLVKVRLQETHFLQPHKNGAGNTQYYQNPHGIYSPFTGTHLDIPHYRQANDVDIYIQQLAGNVKRSLRDERMKSFRASPSQDAAQHISDINSVLEAMQLAVHATKTTPAYTIYHDIKIGDAIALTLERKLLEAGISPSLPADINSNKDIQRMKTLLRRAHHDLSVGALESITSRVVCSYKDYPETDMIKMDVVKASASSIIAELELNKHASKAAKKPALTGATR